MKEFSVSKADSITPDDAVDVDNPGFGLWVGVAGNVKITTQDDSTFTLPNVAAGFWHPQSVKRVWATGTDATDILVGR